MTSVQTALLAKLPEAFLLHEMFTRSGAGVGTEIRDLSGVTVLRLSGGETAAFRALWREGAVEKIETLSDGRGASPITISFMRAS